MSAMTLIQHIEVPSTSSPITLSSIPQTYDDLLIKVNLKVFRDGTEGGTYLRFNSDSTNANYRYQRLRAEYGYGVYAQYNNDNASGLTAAYAIYNSEPSTLFAAGDIYIANYTSSDVKIISSYAAAERNNANGLGEMGCGGYEGTSGISRIDFYDTNGSSYLRYSTVTLFGITKAA